MGEKHLAILTHRLTIPVEAFLYQSGPACRIYLLADGSNLPAEDFLSHAAHLHPDEFA
jgi:hypothetical protein